ncbi:MAG: FAD-dependent oxidoreductase [Planctomycetia bacterium]|nr:FAD-dependent oxidoreductase [Planctomycetia bacterium]
MHSRSVFLLLAGAFLCLLTQMSSLATSAELFVEAESFDEIGGWVVDTQCIDATKPGQAGSVLLLAHGMGRPVADAKTTIIFPQPGKWRVFVRTRNWASFWIPNHLHEDEIQKDWSPGKFQIAVGETTLPTIHGVKGSGWAWHYGGEFVLKANDLSVQVALKDITGFEGRVDALYFTTESGCRLPNDPEPLRAERRRLLKLPNAPEAASAGEYDLVVVGGGLAGCSTAIAAARMGLKTALIQNRPVLGGNGSAEIAVPFQGKTNLPPYPNIGNLTNRLGTFRNFDRDKMTQEDADREALVRSTPNLELFLNTHVQEVETQGGRIVAVVGQNVRTSRRIRFAGRLFADCTGDGTVGFLAGADYRMGREAREEFGESIAPETPDAMLLGSSLQWSSHMAKEPSTFPYPLRWAVQFGPENFHPLWESVWYWECGLRHDQVFDIERIRDHAFRAIYGNWSAIKNNSAWSKLTTTPRYELKWVAFNIGKRESRRLMGDFIITQKDLVENIPQPDGCVATSWHIDLHHPTDPISNPSLKNYPTNPFGEPEEPFYAFLREGTDIKSYAIPYRCLYSRNIENLFMAGRNISASHVGFGAIRVMRTGSMMGEVVGLAASVCKKNNCRPRDVYEKHWNQLEALLKSGVPQ